MAKHCITAEDYELAGFFNVEPRLFEAGVGWPYNEAVFDTTVGAANVVFVVSPAEFIVHLTIKHHDKIFFDMQACQVVDVCVLSDRNQEVLEIVISDHARLRLSLQPWLEIKHDEGLRLTR